MPQRELPVELRDDSFRFVLLKSKNKIPFENKWQIENNYKWSDIKIKSHLINGGNIGIIGGYGNLRILDCDKTEFAQEMMGCIPDTFIVKTGGGGLHFYFKSDYSSNHVFVNEKGEFRADRYQVACPPSIHPNGNAYEVYNNKPIVTLSAEEVKKIISPHLRSQAVGEEPIGHQEQPKDETRSGKEYREVIRLIRKGLTKEQVFKEMQDYSKWKEAHPTYRENTYNKARSFVENKGLLNALANSLKTADNKLTIIENFWIQHPFFYDRKQMFWFWKPDEFRYVLLDDTDLLNMIDQALHNQNTISPKQKSEYIECLKRIGRKHIPQECPPTWVQCNNTIIDMSTQEIIRPESTFFLTNPLPYQIGSKDTTPVIDKLFTEWVGEKYVQTLYEVMAFTMMPQYFIHRIFVFVGGGMNGKSTFFDLLMRFIGKRNCTSTELELLTTNRFEVAKLYKKLICFMGETNFNQLNKTSLIKRLTGNDLIGFEFKNKNPFEDINYAKIMIATNTLPMTSDKTLGFYRRWEIIDFPSQFEGKKDVLKDVTIEEMQNLTRRCVNILFELYKTKTFTNEGSVEERMQKYEEKSNPLLTFIKKCVKLDVSGYIFKYDFRDRFLAWQKQNRYRLWNDKEISLTIKSDLGLEEKRVDNQESGERYWAWLGVCWNENETTGVLARVSGMSRVSPISSLFMKEEVGVTLDKVDTLAKNTPYYEINNYKSLKEYINSLSWEVDIEDILKKCENREWAEQRIAEMIKEGDLYEPKKGFVKKI